MLITGGAGFIGTNFVYYMLKEHPHYECVVLDKLTYAGRIGNLEEAMQHDNFKFVRGDIADKELVFDLFEDERFDVVVNFAAESHVDRSIENPTIFTVTNVIGTQTLMDAGRKHGIKRFHQVSTDEVYGDLPLDRPDLKFTEESPIRPSSPYAASKAAADLMVMAYHRTFKLPVTISRCSNNYGPYQHEEKLIPKMISLALQGEPLPIYGNGMNVRDWIHVYDHCHAIDEILKLDLDAAIFNIGGNNEMTNIDIVLLILNMTHKSRDLLSYIDDRPGHDLRYAIDCSRLRNFTPWKPTVNFGCGIQSLIESIRAVGNSGVNQYSK